MLSAAQTTLQVLERNGTYEVRLKLTYKGVAVNLSAYTVRLSIEHVGTNVACSVEPEHEEGVVTCTLPRATTKTLPEPALGYSLWLEQGEGADGWAVLEGEIPVRSPKSP